MQWDLMCYYPLRKSTPVTPSNQCRLCLVKDMKTLCVSVNYAAGMSAEPPQCVEQLIVRLAWLCVSSGCLAGWRGGGGRTCWCQCRKLIGPAVALYGYGELQSHYGATTEVSKPRVAKRSSIFVPCVHCTLWGNTQIHAGEILPFHWLFVDVARFPVNAVNAISPCGLQAMFFL